jgi:hypothetical protein
LERKAEHIKHCNPRLRAALVETGWRLVRFSPTIGPFANGKSDLSAAHSSTGPARKNAVVALARQLAIDLWRIRTGRPGQLHPVVRP